MQYCSYKFKNPHTHKAIYIIVKIYIICKNNYVKLIRKAPTGNYRVDAYGEGEVEWN